MLVSSGEQQQADAPLTLTLIVYHLVKQTWPRVTGKITFGLQNLTYVLTGDVYWPRVYAKVCRSDGDTPQRTDRSRASHACKYYRATSHQAHQVHTACSRLEFRATVISAARKGQKQRCSCGEGPVFGLQTNRHPGRNYSSTCKHHGETFSNDIIVVLKA